MAAGCIIAGSMAVPMMQCHLFQVSSFSFSQPQKDDRLPAWYHATNRTTGAQTQDPEILSELLVLLNQHQAKQLDFN